MAAEAVLAIRPSRPWPIRPTQTRAWRIPKQNSAPRTPLLLTYPKFASPLDWPTHMKIPRTAPGWRMLPS